MNLILLHGWQASKKDEDKDIWWNALSSIKSKNYITITMTVWPEDGVNVEKLKEMIENNGVGWLNQKIYHEDQVVAEVIKMMTSIWPKPAM
jgi:hypothetical protein